MRRRKDIAPSGKTIVTYGGTHQAFHQALAAQETGHLAAFLCSVYNAPGKWGGRLAKLLGQATTANRRIDGFDPTYAVEYPWPFLLSRSLERFGKAGERDWLWMGKEPPVKASTWLINSCLGFASYPIASMKSWEFFAAYTSH